LKRSGLKPGQIQHVWTLYNKEQYSEASAYLRRQGVSKYRRQATREARVKLEYLRREAANAKREKLGTDKYIEFANELQLRDMRDRSADYLRRRARDQKPTNPFWYHLTRGSYTAVALGG
jgi:hypothetical protein